ncbi:NAD(P)/FAD-dependent oxidoreductase [Patescibacteria group bacterium]|nr:NAD(P)/FAD-dependent oxidoreductase [Patescibacteria group bacterium]
MPKLTKSTSIWDVTVIGGGPAGMMAAIEAGARGKRVLLIEKNAGLGKKLLITGGGRCNVTNNKPVVREMLSQYKEAGKFLFSTFMQYGVKETIDFFARYNLPFIEENEGRLFPNTQKAESVFNVLQQALQEHAVTIQTGKKVAVIKKAGTQFSVELSDGEQVLTQAVVVATGGTARPETGSTGEGFQWLAELGHTIHAGSTSLVPITVAEDWVAVLGGVSLPEATLSIYCNGTKRHKATGKLLFTHIGLSGPLILNQSKLIGDLLVEGDVVIKIDITPTIDASVIQAELLALFTATPNKKLKNVLGEIIKPALVTPLLQSLMLDGDVPVHSITAANRKRIGVVLKALPLSVTGLLGPDKAVATAGGVDLTEVDFKTMESKIIPGLYIIGDVLDINRPSGGYSLQLTWSTGAVAGRHV